MDKMIKTTTNVPEMCECERLYVTHVSHLGKKMCPACYTGYSVEDLEKLWSTPVPENLINIFGKRS